MWTYIASYGKDDRAGIYGLSYDAGADRFAEPKLLAAVTQASFLTRNAPGTHLYATLDHDAFGGNPGGGVAAFAIDGASHDLRPLNRQRTGKGGNCYVGTTPDGRSVLTADYGDAEVALTPAKEDGTLGPVAATDTHTGHGPDQERQEKAHAHCFISDPAGRFALSCDLGTDEVYVYRIDSPPGLTRQGVTKVSPGSGPRHLRFGKDGRFVYVLNELDNTLDAFRWDGVNGAMDPVQRVRTLPAKFAAYSKASEVAMHPTGQFLYAANRGHDSIAVFHIDRDTGHLSPAGHTPCGGKSPRHFGVDPTGRVLMVCNEESDNVAAFNIDAEHGTLTPTAVATVKRAMCVVFTDA